MLGRYLTDAAEGVAAAGVRLMAAVVDAAAPALDAAGWAAVVEALLSAVADDPLDALSPEANGSMQNGVHYQSARPALSPGPSSSPGPGTCAGEGTAVPGAAALRRRCRVLVQLQRLVARVHQRHAPLMPPPLALQLVGVLQDTVAQASTFNRNAGRRAAAAEKLGASPRRAALPPSCLSDAVLGVGGGEAPPGPAAVRAEAEGGALLVAALLRCMQPAAQGDPDVQARVTAEAEQRLLAVCRAVVVQAAADAWAAHEAATTAAAAAATAASGATGVVSAAGRAGVTEDVPWEAAARGPLLVAILKGYTAVSPPAWREELTALYPHLAKLVCSGQPGVRTALGALLRSQLPPSGVVS